MDTYFLKSEDIFNFFDRINEEFDLYVPVKKNAPFKVKCDYGFSLPCDDYILKRYSQINKDEVVFNEYRCVEPVSRGFFTQLKEELCSYFKEGKEPAGNAKPKPVAIAGVKNCDIFSGKVQDFVFLEGSDSDPLYKSRRESALIISSDCPSFKEVCFCRAFEINPHASEGFDFNLSVINNGYLVDVGSEKAQSILDSVKDIFTPATFGQISARATKRESVIKRMQEHLAHHKIPGKDTLQDIVLSGYNSKIWQEQMTTCVECGGCIFICDTCHCFLLSDEETDKGAVRKRMWDGCLLKNFTKVAGGANPLRMRYMRLRNRYLKKFDFFVSNIGYQACCGCGRCIEVCPGKIDIRYILRKLYEEKHIPAA